VPHGWLQASDTVRIRPRGEALGASLSALGRQQAAILGHGMAAPTSLFDSGTLATVAAVATEQKRGGPARSLRAARQWCGSLGRFCGSTSPPPWFGVQGTASVTMQNATRSVRSRTSLMLQDEEPDRFADYLVGDSVTNLCASAFLLKSQLRGKGGRLVVWGQPNVPPAWVWDGTANPYRSCSAPPEIADTKPQADHAQSRIMARHLLRMKGFRSAGLRRAERASRPPRVGCCRRHHCPFARSRSLRRD
jgi:hypothetical protein